MPTSRPAATASSPTACGSSSGRTPAWWEDTPREAAGAEIRPPYTRGSLHSSNQLRQSGRGPDAPSDPGRSLLCPGCGYDLRGTIGGRCSECGLEIDRAALERSGFPWAHRASLGRVRAFLKTVWLVTVD